MDSQSLYLSPQLSKQLTQNEDFLCIFSSQSFHLFLISSSLYLLAQLQVRTLEVGRRTPM